MPRTKPASPRRCLITRVLPTFLLLLASLVLFAGCSSPSSSTTNDGGKAGKAPGEPPQTVEDFASRLQECLYRETYSGRTLTTMDPVEPHYPWESEGVDRASISFMLSVNPIDPDDIGPFPDNAAVVVFIFSSRDEARQYFRYFSDWLESPNGPQSRKWTYWLPELRRRVVSVTNYTPEPGQSKALNECLGPPRVTSLASQGESELRLLDR